MTPEPTTPAVVTVEYAVELADGETATIRGQVWTATEPRTVLLLHDVHGDLDDWETLPAILAATARTAVVAVDLPGHGLSDGAFVGDDLPPLVRRLREAIDPPVEAIVAIGGASTGMLGIVATAPLAGLVLIEPTLPADGMTALARSPRTPKFYVARTKPETTLAAARALANHAGGWAVVSAVPGEANGASLFGGAFAPRLQEQIAGFLRNCWLGA